MEDSVTFALRGSNVKPVIECAPDLPPALIDEGQIGQVLNNLVINADQAMPEGGFLRVRAENTTIEPANVLRLSPGPYLKLVFRDEGGGIPEETGFKGALKKPYLMEDLGAALQRAMQDPS